MSTLDRYTEDWPIYNKEEVPVKPIYALYSQGRKSVDGVPQKIICHGFTEYAHVVDEHERNSSMGTKYWSVRFESNYED
jgi:hypothetical protein